MTNLNEVAYFSQIRESEDAKTIIKDATELAMSAITRDYSSKGLKSTYSMTATEYKEKNEKVKLAWLAFSAANSGIKDLSEDRQLAYAFQNPTFTAIANSIIAETVLGVVTNTNPSQLMSLANVDDVEIGGSKSYEIESKGLPIAQRGSYGNNVALFNTATAGSITVTPKVYTLGSAIDFIRVLTNTFDFGKEIAKVSLGLVYAQVKLVSGILFDSTPLASTPLYQATFSASTYTQMISDLQMLNAGAGVQAFGTLPAHQAIGTVATTNFGFTAQDELVREGYLGRAYGIDNRVIDQMTDLSAPFNTTTASSLRLIPNNKVLLISDTGDKPVKLVRENFVRVIAKEASNGALNRMTYTYSMSFDAGLITQGHYAIQGC